jgi:hypothetical protein
MAYSLRNSYKLYSQWLQVYEFMSNVMLCPVDFADGWWGSPRRSGSPNFYVEIKVGDTAVQKTKKIEGNERPVWNQEFIMYV